MAKHDDRSGNLVCSFCGKSQDEVRKLIAGPTVYICDECIDLCNDIIAEETDSEEAFSQTSAVPKPAEIKRVLAAKRINVTISTRFSTRLDMDARGLESIVRASVHYYNSEEEVERFVREVRSIAA